VFTTQVVETIDGFVGQVTTVVNGKTMIADQTEPYDETKLSTEDQKGSEEEVEKRVRDAALADARTRARKAVRSLFTAQES